MTYLVYSHSLHPKEKERVHIKKFNKLQKNAQASISYEVLNLQD